MTVQTVEFGGKRFVIMPELEFNRLRDKAEEVSAHDKGDVAESKRRKAKGSRRPYGELRKELKLG